MCRTILYILILFLFGVCCSGIADTGGSNKNPSKCLLQLGEICIDARDGAQGAVLTIAVGMLTKIDGKLFRQAVDKVLVTYNSNPKMISTLGLVLSIAFLKDSLDDYGRIAEIYDPQIKNALMYKDIDLRLQRLKEIKTALIADQERQLTMGVIKGISAVAFGFIASCCTVTSWLFWPMAGAAAVSGTAALINGYNYHKLSTLLIKLKDDGHLD